MFMQHLLGAGPLPGGAGGRAMNNGKFLPSFQAVMLWCILVGKTGRGQIDDSCFRGAVPGVPISARVCNHRRLPRGSTLSYSSIGTVTVALLPQTLWGMGKPGTNMLVLLGPEYIS